MIEVLRSKKVVIPAVVFVGGTAIASCSSKDKSPKNTALHEAAQLYTTKVQRNAAWVLRIAKSDPTGPVFKPGWPHQFKTKPAYTIGFTQGTTDGGTIAMSVQTATPQYRRSQTEMLEVQKTNKDHTIEYDLSIYALAGGSWTSQCESYPNTSHGSTISVIDLQTVEHNGRTVDTLDIEAQRVFDIELTSLKHVIYNAAHNGTGPVRASSNLCQVSEIARGPGI